MLKKRRERGEPEKPRGFRIWGGPDSEKEEGMGILYEETGRVFTLQTKNSTYQMKADEQGVLLHTYYGEKTDDTDLSGLIAR